MNNSVDDEVEEYAIEPEDEAKIRYVLELLHNDFPPDDVAMIAIAMAEEFDEKFQCKECEDDVIAKQEFFFVHEELREQVGLGDGGMLCVECFEKRLGRELSYFDFTSTMVGDLGLPQSEILRSRLISGLEETLPKLD